MSALILKLIAMGTMLTDHIGYGFLTSARELRVIGRLAFILYAFLMAESYFHLRRRPDRLKFHLVKLAALCLITEVPFDLFLSRKYINLGSQSTLFTLTLGFAALILCGWWSKKAKSRAARFAGCAVLCLAAAAASHFIRSEYKITGVLLIAVFYLYLKAADRLCFPARLAVLLGIFAVYLPLYVWTRTGFGDWAAVCAMARRLRMWLVGTAATAVPIAFYNRKLGWNSRWFSVLYSVFYPLQFLVLVIVRALIAR